MTFFYIWFGLLSFVLGSVMGSAMTCLGDRLAEGKSWVKGRSVCDVCGHELGMRDLIPVFSYLVHHGRCRYCGAKLPKKYLWTELLTGAVFVLFFVKDGMDPLKLIYEWGICSALLALSVTDLDCYIIPDRFIVFLIVWRVMYLLTVWSAGMLSGSLVIDDLLGAFVPSAFILILSLIMERILKKEAMGGGDIKLLFALGLQTGLAGSLLLVIMACLIGLIFVLLLKKEKIPFGPAISLAAVFVLLYGNGIIVWYMGLLG